jgi:hypothetical protein
MKRTSKRLTLHRETMRTLTGHNLSRVGGGYCGTMCPACEFGPHLPHPGTDNPNPDTVTFMGCV